MNKILLSHGINKFDFKILIELILAIISNPIVCLTFKWLLHNTASSIMYSTDTCFIQKIYAPLTQLYRYTPEIFLFSTATFRYTYRAPLRRFGQEYSANVAFSTFKSLKRIQPLPICARFFLCIWNSLDRPCVTMPSWSSPLKCKVSL